MTIYYIITGVVLFVQVLILLEGYRNLVYTRRTYRPKPSRYQPRAALIAPCKGIDTAFDRNIHSFFDLDYVDYEIFFVVESEQDPAYARLQQIIAERQKTGNRIKTHLVVAGLAQTSSQKLHNLITACDSLPDGIEALAFVDSDACLKPHWLKSLMHPLRRRDVGATTGYRWFVPTDSRFSSCVLSSMNACIGSLMGPHNWNSAWGGAMAIRREVFDRIGLRQAWTKACADDYMLTYLVKKAKLRIVFVPACFVASHEKMSWAELFSFGRRQFIITRVCMKKLWYLALLSSGHFVLAFWGGLFFSLYLFITGSPQAPWVAVLPGGLLVSSMVKALARQIMIRKILPENREQLRKPALLDVFFHPWVATCLFLCVLAAASTRVIVWRGKQYRLHARDHTEIIPVSAKA